MRLSGKHIVVTGAGGGIGRAIAGLLAAEGAAITVADIDETAARAVAQGLSETGAVAYACRLDLADADSVREMIGSAQERSGGIDALVNNAAATHLAAIDGGIEDMDVSLWDETMRINLRGTMLACKFALPALRKRGGGAIVNIASGSALRGALYPSAYSASKAGVVSLSQNVAAQHGREGIRCNAIAPGAVLTSGTEAAFAPFRDAIQAQYLSNRLGVPGDIAWAVLWLVADEGAFVNGQCISVDGGVMSHQRFWMDIPMSGQ